jgi:uroporphyrinogen-III decarboxylase
MGTNRRRPDGGRFLEAIAGGAPSAPPFFEEVIERGPAEAVLGRTVAGDTREMDPRDYLALAMALGVDAVVAHTGGWLGGGRYERASDGSRHYVGGSAVTEEDLLGETFDPREARHNVEMYVSSARGAGPAIVAWLPGVITGPAIALGYEAFALALYDAPDLIGRACEEQTERTLRALDAAAEAGADSVALGDDISDSSGPMMAPERLRDLWLPGARAIAERARRLSLPIMLHCCGRLEVVLSLAVEAGFDAIQPVAGCNDVAGVMRNACGRIAVAGTVDVGSVLVRGAAEEVAAVVREHWQSYGPAGFVLGSNHSINDAVPPENLRALARAVAELS